MELQFKKDALQWMRCVQRKIQSRELTQELKLTDGMPEIGRVLGAWGQPILRGKEWSEEAFRVSGGMMVWVLYAPEDGSQTRCVSGWIPWQLSWDLPSGTPDGKIRVHCLTKSVDARAVSPRKIMVRAGISALGEGLVEAQGTSWTPSQVPGDVQLLEESYPLRVCVEAGEKSFSLDEELMLPASAPKPEKLVSFMIQPGMLESRVLGSRLVFRGTMQLHLVYAGEDGQLHAWDFPLNLSQFADLGGTWGPDAQAQLWLIPSDLDVDLKEEGRLALKASLVAQYCVEDVRMLRCVRDAYSPFREVDQHWEEQTAEPILEKSAQTIPVLHTIAKDANLIADAQILPDYPRQTRMGDQTVLEQPATWQVLYYDPEGVLQCACGRWEGRLELSAHEEILLQAIPGTMELPEAQITGDGIRVTGALPLDVLVTGNQRFSMVTGLDLGEQKSPDPNRPSLILCRAGETSLWQLARDNGSTVKAIRDATGLEGDAVPGQLLLIPVI